MTAYTDIMEEDGTIIVLDQEKAYDRIQHTYLFETLETFNLPHMFINTVKNLYKSAYTHVVINGFISSPCKVTRGICQGDPLSCLLFNLAIEPLACMLRNSTKIKGYLIPGIVDRIKVNMYTDDTTVYLSKEDKYSDLEEILKLWCLASGAKFNLEKTEILPIGSKTHRTHVIEQRKINTLDNPWNTSVKVAKGGCPIRSLGAWVSNDVDQAMSW